MASIGMNTGTGLTSVAPQLFTTSAVSSASVPQYVFQNTNTNTASYPAIKIDRTAPASLAGDTIATISTFANIYIGATREYARITAIAQNVGSVGVPTNIDGTLKFQALVNDAFNTFLTLNGSSQDVDIGKRLDMNSHNIATTTGNLTLDASVSSGTGNISIQSKAGATINVNSGSTGRINLTTLTQSVPTTNNVIFYARSNGLQGTNYLKCQLAGVDIWIPYLTTDPNA